MKKMGGEGERGSEMEMEDEGTERKKMGGGVTCDLLCLCLALYTLKEKSPICTQKSHIYTQKSPKYTQRSLTKSYVHTQMSPIST